MAEGGLPDIKYDCWKFEDVIVAIDDLLSEAYDCKCYQQHGQLIVYGDTKSDFAQYDVIVRPNPKKDNNNLDYMKIKIVVGNEVIYNTLTTPDKREELYPDFIEPEDIAQVIGENFGIA